MKVRQCKWELFFLYLFFLSSSLTSCYFSLSLKFVFHTNLPLCNFLLQSHIFLPTHSTFTLSLSLFLWASSLSKVLYCSTLEILRVCELGKGKDTKPVSILVSWTHSFIHPFSPFFLTCFFLSHRKHLLPRRPSFPSSFLTSMTHFYGSFLWWNSLKLWFKSGVKQISSSTESRFKVD